jgi:hypothetical protein
LSEAIKNDIKEANESSWTIENAGLKNGGEITIKQYFKLSKRELSEAIENDIKEANESSRTPTELREHFAECRIVGARPKQRVCGWLWYGTAEYNDQWGDWIWMRGNIPLQCIIDSLVWTLCGAAWDVKMTTIMLHYWCVERRVELFIRDSAGLH